MSEDVFKAPKDSHFMSPNEVHRSPRASIEMFGDCSLKRQKMCEDSSPITNRHMCNFSPVKRRRTRDDFFTFCNVVLQYTQYRSPKEEVNVHDWRSQHNSSPLDSADSYTSDSTSSNVSTSCIYLDQSQNDGLESEDETAELITCLCMKPYAGRPMIECSVCLRWLHLSCVKLRKSNIPDIYICQQCKDSQISSRKSGRARTEVKRLGE